MDGTDPFRVGIVGSRRRNSYKDRGYVFRIVDGLLCAFRGKRPVVVVSGGAAGPDSFAEEAADVLGAGKLIHRIEPRRPLRPGGVHEKGVREERVDRPGLGRRLRSGPRVPDGGHREHDITRREGREDDVPRPRGREDGKDRLRIEE
jgi:hypothetical protein